MRQQASEPPNCLRKARNGAGSGQQARWNVILPERSSLWLLCDGCANLTDMSKPTDAALLDGLLDPLSHCLDAESARRLAEFRADPGVLARIDTLAEQANDGTLSDDERAEYEALINAADLIAALKLKAQHRLSSNGS
jgi:hypothetical protein